MQQKKKQLSKIVTENIRLQRRKAHKLKNNCNYIIKLNNEMYNIKF